MSQTSFITLATDKIVYRFEFKQVYMSGHIYKIIPN